MRPPSRNLVLAYALGLAELTKVSRLVVAVGIVEHVPLNNRACDMLNRNAAVISFGNGVMRHHLVRDPFNGIPHISAFIRADTQAIMRNGRRQPTQITG